MKMNSVSKRYLELWERFSNHQDFERLTSELKHRYDIEEIKKIKRWGRKFSEEWEDAVYDILFALLPSFKYMEPEGNFLYSALETYLFYGTDSIKSYIGKEPFYGLGVRIFDTREKHRSELIRRRTDGVYIYVPPYISFTQFSDVMKYKWADVEKMLQKKNGSKKNYSRLKNIKSSNWDDIRLVTKLTSESREKLGVKKGELKNYGVSRILKEKYGKKISPASVKTIASRQKKRGKGY